MHKKKITVLTFKNKKAQIIQNKKSGSHSVICGLRLVLLILHCPYTQISPSLHLILSLLSLDNFLIDFQAFMD